LILVDSSVWVDFFSRTPRRPGAELRRLIQNDEPIALTGVVVAEILQGLKRDPATIERFLAHWEMLEPSGFPTYSSAASIYRAARSKGIATTTIDTLIAAIALENGATVFTAANDFSRIASITGLALHRF